ncbi:hypothetical protein [Xanthomonas citri]|uniref:hypothetical protein n=1 Tax=Xanthomonas citri TaxID=346 RepID=UPI000B5CC1D4|nr:hypothetical protein [Xanthomonas citri]ASL01763.1 hypothetical protein XcvCFBP7113P_16705 [Xanthomonas citri pv. vignicola]
MATEKKHALYLKHPDEDRIELVHADDVEDRKAEGWKEPEGMKANGEEWNREDDLPGQDIAADIAKQTAEADAKRAEQKQKEADAEKAKAEAAAKKAEVAPAKK